MSEFLDDEWIASWVGRGTAPGPTATVQVVVTGTDVPNDGKWHLRLDDGVVAEAAPGTVTAARPHAHGRLPGGGGDGGGGARPERRLHAGAAEDRG